MKVSAPTMMLAGDPGAGKTFCLATLARENRKLFYLFTDPGGEESLIDGLRHYKIPVTNVHWHYVSPSTTNWATLATLLDKVNSFDYATLAGMKQGIDKSEHRQFFALVASCADFTCDRTGKSFGSLSELDPETSACAFDGLTGLNKLAKETTVGGKPTLHEGEWAVAMALEETFIRQFVSDIPVPKAMVCHLTKVMNHLEGRMTFGIHVLGQKLAPQLPHMFSDVVHCWREGKDFYWSTVDDRITLKSRNLPFDNKIAPDFEQVLERWQERKKMAEDTTINEIPVEPGSA